VRAAYFQQPSGREKCHDERHARVAISHNWEEEMKGFVADIEELTEENSDFRRVLYTGKNLQLVLMSIEPGGEIG
jgi:quercetin dioxygenase-like cupin family protein